MPKTCNVLIIVLALSLVAAVVSFVYFAQSPPSQGASSQLPISGVAQSSLSTSTQQNATSAMDNIYLITALFAVPLALTGYLFYKCRLLVHKSPLFFRG